MKIKLTRRFGGLFVGVLAGSIGSAYAVPSNITVLDPNPVKNAAGWGQLNNDLTVALNGPRLEDQETEPGTAPGQIWDLEMMIKDGSTLYLVAGYDFKAGLAGGLPGDLFINKTSDFVAGSENLPTSNVDPIKNGDYYNYDFAVNLSGPANSWVDGVPTSVGVFTLDANSMLNSVINDSFKSNPWKVVDSTTPDASTSLTYYAGKTAAQVAAITGLASSGSLLGGSHYILRIDLGFVGATPNPSDVTTLSYTMECGNDSLKGRVAGGFRAPDGGMTLSLLGLGVGALAIASRRK